MGWLVVLMLASLVEPAFAADASDARGIAAAGVLEHHGNAGRSGMFVVPSLTFERARNLHRDSSFHAGLGLDLRSRSIGASREGQGAVAGGDRADRSHTRCGDQRGGLTLLGAPLPRSNASMQQSTRSGSPVPHHRRSQTLYVAALTAGQDDEASTIRAHAQGGRAIVRLADRCRGRLEGERQELPLHRPESAQRAHDPQRHTLRALWRTLRRLRRLPRLGRWCFAAAAARYAGMGHPRAGRRHLGTRRACLGRPEPLRGHRKHVWRAYVGRRRGCRPTRPDHRSRARRRIFALSDWQNSTPRTAISARQCLVAEPARRETSRACLALGKDGKAYLLDRQNLGGIGGSVLAKKVRRARSGTAPAWFSR